jgi:cell division septal protein FtsQ
VSPPDRGSPFLRRDAGASRPRRKPSALRMVFGAAILLVAGAGLVRFLGGQRFSLRRFEISGNSRARTEEILDLLSPYRGRNLVMLDLEPVAGSIASHPWVQTVTLTKRFPDGLTARVIERSPLALYREGNRFFFVGSAGRLIAPYDSRRDLTKYVVLSGERRALPEAVALLEVLRASRPEYFSALSEIASLPDGGFGMMDAIFRRPVRVLRADAPEKIRALLEARGFIESRGWEARAIDLRFADRIVLVGAYGAGNRL